MSDFDALRKYWDKHAEQDPLWAVLSDRAKSGGRWDVGRFFQTGVSEVASVLYQFDSRQLDLARRTALDFGCGVGRLTQALATHFDRVVGVDVSPRMLERANHFNAFPSRVSYVSNQRDDLRRFDDAAFDFVISNIVLQHLEPALALAYLGEFFRVLAPDGALVFQIPSHQRTSTDEAPPSGPSAMPDEAYQAVVEVTGVSQLQLPAGSSIALDLAVSNVSPYAWSAAESGIIRAGNHWRDGSGARMLRRDDGRSSLPGLLRPGERCRLALTITTPDEDGEYVCEIDLAHEGVLWFNDKGSPTARFPVRVGANARSADGALRAAGAAKRAPEREVDFSVTRVRAPARIANEAGEPGPGDFPMHGIERDVVLELIARNGGRLVHIEDDHSCGDEWVSFRYYVTRGPG